MKKSFLLLITPFFLLGCNNSSIEAIKSPFKDDTYNRIGIQSIYKIESSLTDDEFKILNNAVSKSSTSDLYVSDYTVQDETRDLKYAYFGSEISSTRFNSLTTNKYEHNRYKNLVNIDKTDTLQRVQVTKSENKTETVLTDYMFDTYKDPREPKEEPLSTYEIFRKTEKITPKEDPEVISTIDPKEYTTEQKDQIFSLHPFANDILGRFDTFEGKFKLLGSSAVYGKQENDYVIKEAYSEFKDLQTKLGRNYKSVDNYFYEGLLTDITSKTKGEDKQFGFKEFRFYKETLILSEATNGEGVPVLYLEKPVLVWFNEVKVTINYNDLVDYTGEIPTPTKE